MSSKKLSRPFAYLLALSVVGFGLLANHALAANVYFDINGNTAGSGVGAAGSYTWEGANWNSVAAGTGATAAWVDGDFPRFSAGNDANGKTYTITANSNHTFAGMFVNANAGGTVNLNGGTGVVLSIASGDQGFFVGTPAAQSLKINANLGGVDATSRLVWQSSTTGGSLFLYGNNTFAGGVLLNTAQGLNFNNANSFGTGTITWGAAQQVLADPDAVAPLTIANKMATRAASQMIFVTPAAAPVTFSGAWTLAAGVSTLTPNNAATSITVSGAIAGTDGTSNITKTGVGLLTLTNAANSYAGGTIITAGTLGVGNNAALGAGLVTLNAGTIAASGGARTIANNATIAANSTVGGTDSFTFNGSFTNSGGNRVLTSTNTAATALGGNVYLSELAGTGRTLILAGSTTNNPVFTISGNISDFNGSGAAGSIQVGNGSTVTQATLTLTGTNTHSGATNVSTASTLKIGSAGALGTSTLTFTGSSNFFDNTTGSALVLTNNIALPNGSPTFVGTDDLTLGNLSITAANRTLSVSAKTLTVNDVTQDSARNLTKGGAGKLVIKGNAGYTGTTTISGGTLQIGNGGTTGTLSTSSPIVDNANLTFNRSNAVTQGTDFAAGPITGTGTLTKEGSGILTLTGKNTYGTIGVVGTTVNAGTLLVNTPGPDSGTGVGDVLVTAGKLGGTGRIGGSVSVTGGSLSPGASINVLDIGGNLSMSGGSFDYEINSTTTTADLNTVVGNLSLASVALSGSELGAGMLPFTTKFTLINYGGTWDGGTFTGYANHSTNLVIGANRFQIDYDDTTGGTNFGGGTYGGGIGSHFVTITAVPEASAFLTIGLGGIFAIAAVWMSKRLGVSVLKV